MRSTVASAIGLMLALNVPGDARAASRWPRRSSRSSSSTAASRRPTPRRPPRALQLLRARASSAIRSCASCRRRSTRSGSSRMPVIVSIASVVVNVGAQRRARARHGLSRPGARHVARGARQRRRSSWCCCGASSAASRGAASRSRFVKVLVASRRHGGAAWWTRSSAARSCCRATPSSLQAIARRRRPSPWRSACSPRRVGCCAARVRGGRATGLGRLRRRSCDASEAVSGCIPRFWPPRRRTSSSTPTATCTRRCCRC